MNLKELSQKMNLLGSEGTPFLVITDFSGTNCRIWSLSELPKGMRFQFPSAELNNSGKAQSNITLKAEPLSFEEYLPRFKNVINHLHRGDTYLVNLTMPTPVTSSHNAGEIYDSVSALYKLYLPEEFLYFSPESFVKIEENQISSYPMKGTISASIPNAEQTILNDPKETAEHNTIVDLIRNDLSIVAKNVRVPRFRYIDTIATHKGKLLQVSSEIRGDLENNWQSEIGTIFTKLLPAGSISGAPKKKTVEIIRESEPDERGYYTGVTALFDGSRLDSCVNIRFIETNGSNLTYRSGGGITSRSNEKDEYNELLEKIYVPLS